MRDEDLVRRAGGGEMSHPDPRCPQCGYTMCQLFNYSAMSSPLAFTATANGLYQCYHCTPTNSAATIKPGDWVLDIYGGIRCVATQGIADACNADKRRGLVAEVRAAPIMQP